MRAAIAIGTIALVATSCTGSGESGAPTTASPTTSPTSQVITTTEEGTPTTASPSTTTSSTTAAATATTVTADIGVLRIAPAAQQQPFALRIESDGVWATAHTGVYSQIIEGPVTEAADTYLYGVVYQRPGIENRIFVQAENGEDKELLVGTGEQTLTLVGARVPGDDSSRVLYLRRTNSGFDSDSQTLRSYDMDTGEVTEIAEVGGWESATSYSFADSNVLVGRWGAEAYSGLNTININSGSITFGTEAECFYDDYSDTCPNYTDAVLVGQKIYGFGPILELDGSFEEMGLHRYDPASETQELIASWPYEVGSEYESRGMMSRPGEIIVSLADARGNPLPALIYDLATDTASTAPIAGFLRPGYLS